MESIASRPKKIILPVLLIFSYVSFNLVFVRYADFYFN